MKQRDRWRYSVALELWSEPHLRQAVAVSRAQDVVSVQVAAWRTDTNQRPSVGSRPPLFTDDFWECSATIVKTLLTEILLSRKEV